MNKKEFIEKYSINPTIKNVGVIKKLILEDELSAYNYFFEVISLEQISSLSDKSFRTIWNWSHEDNLNHFVFIAVKEKCVRILSGSELC